MGAVVDIGPDGRFFFLTSSSVLLEGRVCCAQDDVTDQKVWFENAMQEQSRETVGDRLCFVETGSVKAKERKVQVADER